MIALAGLRRYPVKSCRGEDLDSATVEPWGLAGDRRWMIVDEAGEKVTARETNVLLTVVPELIPGGVRLSVAGARANAGASASAPEPLEVREPTGADLEVQIWNDRVTASDAGDAAATWFSAIVGRTVRLVFLDDPTRRAVDPQRSRPGDVVTFADGYPMLMASLSSLQQLNDWIGGDAEPLDIRRFRPNLVIDGAEPFAEDTWSSIRVGGEGGTTFRVAQDCSRCVLTTVHPDTITRGHEPIATLSRHRRWDGKVWFAVDLIPEDPGGVLHVGDEVEVLEATRCPAAPRPAVQTAPAPPAA